MENSRRSASSDRAVIPDAVAIGCSTGGPQALLRLFSDLGKGLRQPVFVTQHMPPVFTHILAENIARQTGLDCREAADGMKVDPGRIYIAPGDHHMTVERKGGEVRISLQRDPPVNFCRPAVDPMLESLVDIYGRRILAVILTGMGSDGLLGCRKVAAAGGVIIAQDEKSSTVWGMPGMVVKAGLCRDVVPLGRMAGAVRQLCRMEEAVPVATGDYAFFEEFLRARSGLALTPRKSYLIETRLMPVAAALGLADIHQLAMHLRAGRDRKAENMVVEAMTTNETSFFRDRSPFDILRDRILPELRGKPLRIWSAACSSGQEPYSIAMLLAEEGLRADIVATDISESVLAVARAGVYSQFDVQRGLPVRLLVKYFTKQDDKWAIRPELRDRIGFSAGNLLSDVPEGLFDIIFCRNALMYFSADDRRRVLRKLHGALRPEGYLFMGGAETMVAADLFQPLPDAPGVYRRA